MPGAGAARPAAARRRGSRCRRAAARRWLSAWLNCAAPARSCAAVAGRSAHIRTEVLLAGERHQRMDRARPVRRRARTAPARPAWRPRPRRRRRRAKSRTAPSPCPAASTNGISKFQRGAADVDLAGSGYRYGPAARPPAAASAARSRRRYPEQMMRRCRQRRIRRDRWRRDRLRRGQPAAKWRRRRVGVKGDVGVARDLSALRIAAPGCRAPAAPPAAGSASRRPQARNPARAERAAAGCAIATSRWRRAARLRQQDFAARRDREALTQRGRAST